MIITLYNNCRLTKEYNEVIEHSYLDTYLNSLTKYEYDVPVTYLSRKGQFDFSLTEDSNDYEFNNDIAFNYMKIYDEVNDIVRYYFIEDYEIVNGSIVIDYTEDIYANYGNKINIVKGKVSNLRYGIGQRPFHLPVEYESNDKLAITQLYQNNTEFELIVTISFYVLQASGEPSYRFYRTCYVEHYSNNKSLSATLDILKSVISNSSTPDAFTGLLGGRYNYEVVNAYIIPVGIYNDLNLSLNTQYTFTISGTIEEEDVVIPSGSLDLYEINTGTYIKNYLIPYDKKMYGIGMLDNIIPTNTDGTDIQMAIECRIEDMFVNFILKVGTSIVDLSNSFVVDCPISVQTADVTQQQAIARSVKNQSLDLEKAQIQERFATSYIRGAGQIAQGITSLATSGGIVGISSTASGIANIADATTDTMINLEKNKLSDWETNMAMYKTNTAVSIRDNKFISLIYGLIKLDVVPDNEEYVDDTLEVTGYKVERVVSDNTLLNTPQENKDYNIIKFSNIWLYGNIPHKVQQAVKNILLKGIKIWFTASIS